MDTTEVIITVVVILVLLAIIAAVVMAARKKRRQADAARATELRHEAQQRATDIPQTRAQAQEAEAQAEQARLRAESAEQRAMQARQAAAQTQAEHEDQIRAADRLDPHVDNRSADYTPNTGTTTAAGTGSSSHDAPGAVTGSGYVRAVDAEGRPVDDQVRPVEGDGRTTGTDDGLGGSPRA